MEKQQIRVISSHAPSEEEDRFQRFRVMLQQTGGDPSAVLDMLVTIVRRQDWRRLEDNHRGTMGFIQYFKRAGWETDDLRRFVENMHHKHERVLPEVSEEMDWLRGQIRDYTNPRLRRVGAPEGNQNNCPVNEDPQVNVGNTNIDSDPKTVGNTASYWISRLKRDAPELAERVIQGELSANAAAIQVGFRKPAIVLPRNPEGAVRVIVQHFQGEALDALIHGLVNWAGIELAPEPEHEPR